MFSTEIERVLNTVAGLIQNTQRILFVTGAGISADSGLPTYRGFGGLYNDQSTEDGIPIETALSGEIMGCNPALSWKYLSQIESSCRGAQPNAAHTMLAMLEQTEREVWILTQNIDGLHRMAGSKNLIEIHGNLYELECTACEHSETVKNYAHLTFPPACPKCGNTIRPRVVLFGESLPEKALRTVHREYNKGFDVVFSIGTTSVFPYIAAPILSAREAHIPTIEINPEPTHLTHQVTHVLPLKAALACTALWERAFHATP